MSGRSLQRRIANWVLPPAVEDLIHVSIEQYKQRDPKTRAVLERNRALHNRHVGERCFILATGPSIRKQDLSPLKGEICFAVSNFFVHPDFATIRPTYYCIAAWHEPVPQVGWVEWLRELQEATNPTTTYFLAASDSERVDNDGLFMNRQVHYLQCTATQEAILNCGINLIRPILAPQSVTIMALQAALYMGFKEIYLLGCDHDWILHSNISSHFYDEQQHALTRGGYNEWFGSDLESYCQDYVRLWQQYKAIRRIATNQSAQVFNATDGGMLDVFPRVGFGAFVQQLQSEAKPSHALTT